MVRNYKRRVGSRSYRNYSEENLADAVRQCRNGRNVRDVSNAFSIPYVTLYRKLKGLHPNPHGGQTVLSKVEEKSIANCIATAADWGFPLTPQDVKSLVQNFINRQGKVVPKFINNLPGEGWVNKFLQRHHKQLSRRMSQSIKESRAKVNHQTINKFFDHLEASLEGIAPAAIVNYDETNFTDDAGRVKVVVRRSCKRSEHVMDTSKAATSVMFSCSASGTMLPVYIVYKSDHLWSTWTENGPPNARYNRSKSGWFDGNLFEEWFFTIIVPYFQSLPDGPKALIGDNLASHISVNVIKKCEEMSIKFILLPPNSTQLTQPLDVSVFRPIKGSWRKILREWKKHNKGVVRKDVFPRLLNQTMNSIKTGTFENNIKSGFEATGIFPLNRDMVLKRLPNETTPQNADDLINQSMTDMFKKARFGTGETSKGRKKKLNIEAGKSISQNDLTQGDGVTSAEKPKKIKKNRANLPSTSKKTTTKSKKRYELSSSDSDDVDDVPYINSEDDMDPETFSDVEDGDLVEERENEKTESNKTMNNLNPGDYILVNMKTERGNQKEYVAKIIALEEDNSFLCSFLRKSQKLKNTFSYPLVEDVGIVDKDEVVKQLLNVEILRRGHIRFADVELENNMA